MIIDTSATCDICRMKNVCIREQHIKKLEDVFERAEVRSPAGSIWPLTTYLNSDFDTVLPIKFNCDYFLKESNNE